MNLFLPIDTASASAASADSRRGGGDSRAMLIDFASTGVGFGMADVAMHLSHSVAPETLADGGEERLIDAYLAALAAARAGADSGGGGGGGADGSGDVQPVYDRETAMRHYRLAVIDYGRFVVGRFWSAASPESFEAKARSPNTTLVNRDCNAALQFVRRIDAALAYFEAAVGENGKPPAI